MHLLGFLCDKRCKKRKIQIPHNLRNVDFQHFPHFLNVLKIQKIHEILNHYGFCGFCVCCSFLADFMQLSTDRVFCTFSVGCGYDSILISAYGSDREVSEGVPLSRETACVNTAVLPARTDSA